MSKTWDVYFAIQLVVKLIDNYNKLNGTEF